MALKKRTKNKKAQRHRSRRRARRRRSRRRPQKSKPQLPSLLRLHRIHFELAAAPSLLAAGAAIVVSPPCRPSHRPRHLATAFGTSGIFAASPSTALGTCALGLSPTPSAALVASSSSRGSTGSEGGSCRGPVRPPAGGQPAPTRGSGAAYPDEQQPFPAAPPRFEVFFNFILQLALFL